MTHTPITIIGGGLAGLMAALAAAPAPVRLLNPIGPGQGAASAWSQGGLAAAVGEDDSPALHIADTIAAGAGLCNGAAVRRIIEAGPGLIDLLLRSGVRFDRDAAQALALGLEAAHQRPRILHANGDRTGAEIMRALIEAARATASIEFFPATARKLLLRDGEMAGVLAEAASGPVTLAADRVLLATGGIGGLFRYSTNPPTAIGRGLILAAEAGAQLQHLEFVQFHPTALDASGGTSLPLISEAVRGEGAVLIDETGARFMAGRDLAPRDVVARAVFAHQAAGHRVFLDARMIGARFATRFPAINAICANAQIDPVTQPIPVRPAAHYHMGGVAVDAHGRTSVPGLYAAGEVACTGLHGANRLASNSLLEAAVCGMQAGQDMAARPAKPPRPLPALPLPPRPDAEAVRDIMSTHLGVLRDADGLQSAIAQLAPLAPHNSAAQLALLIAEAALARPASIGAHARQDDAGFTSRAARGSFAVKTCLHELFETQAEQTPDAVAVTFGPASLTYRELNRRADELAGHLRALGVGPDVWVALFLERSLDMVVGMMAVLKAGGAYVPLDPVHPRNRLAYMLEDAQPLILLTQTRLQSELPPHRAQIVLIDGEAPFASAPVASRISDPSHLAYVIYTSGSTGQPKGVEIEHGAVVNMLASMRQRPGLDATDRMLAITTLTFDIAVLEIFLPLVCGACVVIAPSETALDGVALAGLIAQSGVSVMQATPATLRMLLDAGWVGAPDLKVLCGGEAYTAELASQILARCGTLWNMYGPTETTVWSAVAKLEAGRPVVIGPPIANTRLYVLDRTLQLVPVGVPGELCIGGAELARGYRGRPQLTSARFVPDPFATEPGMRMYRTGDLVKRLSDGTIEFLGRLDHQVKIRGFRIEPAEIEGRLREHDAIRDAVVIALDDASGDKRLVAYVVADQDDQLASALRAHLAARLPKYMMPSAYVRLDTFPLTPNGKLDRRALPPPVETPDTRETYEAPQGEAETTLAAIWAELLGITQIGRTDDFFELGGHSLLAIQVLSRLQQIMDVSLKVQDIFENSTLERLAEQIVIAQLSNYEPEELATLLDRVAKIN